MGLMGKTVPLSSRPWRIFAPDHQRGTGVHWLIFFSLFVASLSLISLNHYGELLARPILGVMLAALLLLRKNDAIKFLIASNIAIVVTVWFSGQPTPRLLISPLLNTTEAMLAAMLVRRFCGAQLDIARPIRLAQFFSYAVFPATIYRLVAETATGFGFLYGTNDNLATMLASHVVSMGLLTPLIVLIVRAREKPMIINRARSEVAGLYLLLIVNCLFVFGQNWMPLLFIPFLPLVWIAYRLNQIHSMSAALLVIVIASLATAEGMGPISLIHEIDLAPAGIAAKAGFMRITVLQLFAASTLAVVLPLGAVRAEMKRSYRRAKKSHRETLRALHQVRR